MSTNQPYLSIENVVKQFGQFTAIKKYLSGDRKRRIRLFLGPFWLR